MKNFKVIGHRGARGLAPENTLAGVKKAMQVGVDMIEFDVRVTPNGVPVLHHDRLPSDTASLTTLEQVLKAVNDKVDLYIEVKFGEKAQPIADVLQKYTGRYRLASKSQKTLLALHRALPQAPTIVIESWSGLRARRRAQELDTKTIAMNQLWLWRGFIKAVSNSGYELYAYTLNNPGKARRWQQAGLAGVVTDRPDLFKNL